MFILHIETSTTVCSVALSKENECIFSRSNGDGLNHAALLSIFIAEALEVLKQYTDKPDAVTVSSGPGSYTGLRIGVSTAKGLCYGFGIPLITVDTLKIMTLAAGEVVNDKSALYCAMIDARRMEVYSQISDAGNHTIREVHADIVDNNSYTEYLESKKVYFFGNGSDKCRKVLTHPNAYFIDNIFPLAEKMILPAITDYNLKKFADVAYFEPFYLKEFQATTPKQKL